MAAKSERIELRLSPADRKLLDRLAVALGASRVQVLRWAVHYYAAVGDWCLTDEERRRVVDNLAVVVTGPARRRMQA